MSRKRAAVLLGVHVLFALHIAHWLRTGTTLSPVEPSEAMEFGKHGIVNAGLIFFGATILLTAIFGRFFCGWGCHLVALQDLCRALLARLGLRPRPLRSRLLRLVPLVAFAYMFLWPACYRLLHGIGFERPRLALLTSSFWATFPGPGVALLTFLLCGFVIIYFLGAKGFCTYACPYGAIFGVADRWAPVRVRVTDACESCGHCTAVCTSNVRVHEEVRAYGMVVDPGCMKCMDCVSVCPKNALYVGAGTPAVKAKPRAAPTAERPDCTWPEEILLVTAFALAFFVFRGLYGLVPFLLSLGWAAILSYLTLKLARLVYRPHLRLRGWSLKRHGRLLPAGYLFAASMAALFLFWGHSGLLQYHGYRAERLAASIGELGERASPALIENALTHLDRVEKWGLLPDPRRRSRHARLAALDGQLRFSRGDVEAAIARFEEAVALEPTFVAARENLAGMLCSVGRFEEGLKHFQRAVELSPGDARTHLLMARAYLALGDRASSKRELRRSIDLDPGLIEARRLLAELGGS